MTPAPYTKKPDGTAILDTPEKLLEYTRRVLHREPTPELLRFEPVDDETVFLFEDFTLIGRVDSSAVDALQKIAEKHPPLGIFGYSMRDVAPHITESTPHITENPHIDKPTTDHTPLGLWFWFTLAVAAGYTIATIVNNLI